MARVVILIPARFASSRFPGKPLALINGQSMIERVFKNCEESGYPTYVVTDHDGIEKHVKEFGGKVLRVDDDVPSGSERIALAYERHLQSENPDLVINVQGDEPLLKGDVLAELAEFHLQSKFEITTLLRARSVKEEDFKNPNVVKAVYSPESKQCLYFSRQSLPYDRDGGREYNWYQHIGVYSYKPKALSSFVKLPMAKLEDLEKLEQLRALENQMTIGAVLTTQKLIGVDVPDDVKKYIFITGGVTSSLGKGLAAASIGCLLERRGIKINMLKMDPYINVDPGTMSPTQHGEVFVTDDGAETDLDLGHYERFTSLTLTKQNNFTTGKVYLQVIENEREGKYLGKTVQVVPHITDEIKRRIHVAAEDCDLLIGEIGGTVGDIESLPFMESIRQFALDVGTENVLFVHLVLIPYIEAAGELKSKPAQHSVKEMRSIGLFPQMIICRADRDIDSSIIDKISLFCNVPKQNVFKSIDLDLIYKAPKSFHEQGMDRRICELLGMWATEPKMDEINKVIYNSENPLKEVNIGIVGKYTELIESYKSLDEALRHAAIANQVKLNRIYIDAEDLEKGIKSDLLNYVDGILVPGGFGSRGTEGKIKAIQFAREKKKPFFGICLGLQLSVIEFARNVVGMKDATSMEFTEKGTFVVHYMTGQKEAQKGGSMRLGAYDCVFNKGSLGEKVYGAHRISERHRHRLEVNNDYVKQLTDKGLVVSGKNPDLNLVEVIELKDHPYFIACQYHPEFKSRPFNPHPLFASFVKASAQL